MKEIRLADGAVMPKNGMGTWYMGEHPSKAQTELESLRLGFSLGLNMIDTAEMYGEGLSEELVGKAIAPLPRQELFLVSKVYPFHGGRPEIFRSCEQSLRRLGTDYLDLYLLHWRGSIPLEETIAGMEALKQSGKIRAWGVSNFSKEDMEELWSLPQGNRCVVNQVLYHLGSRGIEYDLLPWMESHQVAAMGYCPLAQNGRLRRELIRHPVLKRIAAQRQITVTQLLLAFANRLDGLAPIPKASTPEHVRQNVQALALTLTQQELEEMSAIFPAPTRKMPLDIV